MRGDRRFVWSRRRWLAPIPLLAFLAFALGGFSTGNSSSVDPACKSNPSAGVEDPGRLSIQSSCAVVTGIIVSRNNSRADESDGDWSFDIQVDSQLQGTYPPILHSEIVPIDNIVPPPLNSHVRLVGPWVYDTQSVSSVPDEIHPVWSATNASCSSCPVASPPGAPPAAPTVVGHNGGVKVSWQAPSDDGGTPITGYVITYSPPRISDGHTESTRSGTGTSTTIEGFANGTTYTFTVSALNGVGRGPASPPGTGTPFTVPNAPTGVSAVAGDRSATVNWSAPSFNGGSAITGYTITAAPGGASKTAAASATSATFTGLTNGTAYTFAVKATNAAGAGAAASSAPVTPSPTPPPPPPGQPAPAPSSAAPPAPAPAAQGYWLASSAGGVYPFGAAGFFGSMAGLHLNQPVVGIAATPSGQGYWMTATDGGIFNFGNARFFGSTGSIRLNQPIVGMASTPTGNGYWLVASDGGIFAYGDAHFYGSTGSIRLNKPIVGMAATPSGNGYWLVASDGGIFAYGDAHFSGSTGSIRLNKPIVGMASTGGTGGYWLVASDGGMFNFGASFLGSSAGASTSPVVGMAATPSGAGYWLATAAGQVFNHGDAAAQPNARPSTPVAGPIVGLSRLP